MSQPNALAALTRTLAGLLGSAVQAGDPAYHVTTLPPDKSHADNHLNLFLFHAAPLTTWRSAEPPSQTWPAVASSPPLALTLSYLVTAYGDAGPEAKDQHLLGLAMQFFHSHPILTAGDIRSLAPGSGLEDQIERVHFTPRALAQEELARWWVAFQVPYRLSAVYDATAVLIDPLAP